MSSSAYFWLAENSESLDKYAGKWVAVSENQLLGVADSLKELMLKPEVKNVRNPLFTKIPLPQEAYSLLNLASC